MKKKSVQIKNMKKESPISMITMSRYLVNQSNSLIILMRKYKINSYTLNVLKCKSKDLKKR